VGKSTVDRQVGTRMRELRDRQGVSLADLAHWAHISPILLADYEAGRIRLTPDHMYRLTRAIGLTIFDVFCGLGDEPTTEVAPQHGMTKDLL
jgi:transcriptional regulator with XRE-family HTH domain